MLGVLFCFTTYASDSIQTYSRNLTEARFSASSNEPKDDETLGFYGVFYRCGLEDNAFKYGGLVDLEGAVIIKKHMGFDFSIGWGMTYKPDFDINCQFGLGPCYGTKLSDMLELYVPAKLMCLVYFDAKDNTKTSWGGRVNPTLLIGKSKCKLGVGAFCDFSKDTSFGLSLGLAF